MMGRQGKKTLDQWHVPSARRTIPVRVVVASHSTPVQKRKSRGYRAEAQGAAVAIALRGCSTFDVRRPSQRDTLLLVMLEGYHTPARIYGIDDI